MPSCPSGSISYIIKPFDTLWMIAQKFNTSIHEIISANPGLNLNYIYVGQTICIRPNSVKYQQYNPNSYFSNKVLNIVNKMRSLWEQHVFWTRAFIMSVAFRLPDLDLVTKRLLQNPMDFEMALKPFYGENIASKFRSLLNDHLVIASNLVKAAKAGNKKAADDAEKKWYANADEIADFLNSINPYWSKETWQKMLHEHLAITKESAVNILKKNYDSGIKNFDQIEKQALSMADYMAKAITKQFPNNLKTS